MKRSNRGPRSGENLSAGRVEYLEQARRRVQARRLRRTVVIVLLLAALVVYATGAVGSSIALAKDLVDSVKIAFLPRQGYPQQTGIQEIYQMEPLAGGYVLLGEEGCVVYSDKGNRLNSIQTSYARPALAVGKTHFVLYNRSGNELRVESRTQNLYTMTMENKARLTVYSAQMEELLRWSVTTTEGTPLRVAFSPDNGKLAVATLTAKDSAILSNLYLLGVSEGDPVCLAGVPGCIPQWVGWTSNREILVIYDDHAALYDTSGAEKGRYDYGGNGLVDFSVGDAGLALLFEGGQVALLNKGLGIEYQGAVPSANRILRTKENFYLLCDQSVEVFGADGVYQWSQQLEAKPEALLAGRQLLLFCSNTVQQLEPPAPEE